MSNPTNASPDSQYIIKASEEEKDRFCQRIFGRATAVPNNIDLSRVNYVMDIAAGTLSWILVFASHPEIKGRLNSKDSPVALYASDITDEYFPSEDVIKAHCIHAFSHDMTKPFPDDLLGKFDLVHVGFVAGSLSTQGWKKALQNISDLLKPGGNFYLRDSETVFYPHPEQVPMDSGTQNLQRVMMGNSYSHKLNTLFHNHAAPMGLIRNLTSSLTSLLEPVNLHTVRTTPALYPWGKHCELYRGLNGEDLSDEVEFTVKSARFAGDILTTQQLRAGELEAPPGVPIRTEEERLQLMEELVRGVEKKGLSQMVFDCLIRKGDS
ncbi:hypothetical protein AX16_007037 [Volvariella volvacea WC 439]|nr:hypothetical protein AX16_007037 [Volvariella volvacea WC 439]